MSIFDIDQTQVKNTYLFLIFLIYQRKRQICKSLNDVTGATSSHGFLWETHLTQKQLDFYNRRLLQLDRDHILNIPKLESQTHFAIRIMIKMIFIIPLNSLLLQHLIHNQGMNICFPPPICE